MNRNIYRLVKSVSGLWVPAPEHTRGQGKGGSKARQALLAAAMSLITPVLMTAGVAYADGNVGLPNICLTCGGAKGFVAYGNAGYSVTGNVGTVSQVGDKAILNWRDFNVANGNAVVFQQVADLLNLKLVEGATFSTLNRIWDQDPSVIAGNIRAATGQHANLMFINQNGIVFANGANVDVNTLTASSLNIKDDVFLNTFAAKSNSAKFQYGMDGVTDNLGGFVKVLDGAKITAASGGRVMLIAPTVTNRGTIETPNGQTILAAGDKVFLQASSDAALRGLLVEVENTPLNGDYSTTNATVPKTVKNPDGVGADISIADSFDKLGNASNLGSITAAKGNITMVGLAVNQMGRATATTAYNANGSIYLGAKSDSVGESLATNNILAASRTGKVTLGENSVTEVLVDTSDQTKSKESFIRSKIDIIGKDIEVKKNAQVIAPSGIVNITATLNPSLLKTYNADSASDPFANSSNSTADTSILFESGAVVDVSGLDVTTSVADNYVKIKLLGDELANSPANRNGALRGKEVWVDVTKGAPLIANIDAYKNNVERTIAVRSTDAGSVRLQSEGKVVVQPDAKFDLSGGKVTYTGAVVNATKLIGADGNVYDMANTSPDMKYTGLANEYTYNDKKWGVTETFSRASLIYNPGYVEGSNAGLLVANTREAYFAGAIDGTTTAGINQLQAGRLPLSAALQIGAAKINSKDVVDDYGLNQNILIGSAPSALSDDNLLTKDQSSNLTLDSALFGNGKIGRLELNSNQSITINKDINLTDGGSFSATASNVNINANIKTSAASVGINTETKNTSIPLLTADVLNSDIQTKSGAISVVVKDNQFNNNPSNKNPNALAITVADNVTLSSTGHWVNDGLSLNADIPKLINAGNITLDALYKPDAGDKTGTITLGSGSLIDVRGGAYRDSSGKITAGKAGDVKVVAANLNSSELLQNHFKGESLSKAGTLDVTAGSVQVGDVSSPTANLVLNTDYFKQGFANYNVTGLAGVTVAENAKINVQSKNLELLPKGGLQANSSSLDGVAKVVTLDESLRKPANISLTASSINDDVKTSTLKISSGAEINTDIGATVDLKASNDVAIDGKVNAPAGVINISIDNKIGVNKADQRIHLGSQAVLAAAGAAQVYPNSKGLNVGSVLSGGTINLTAKVGYVDAEQGALIDVHGVSPTQVDITNVSGRIGQLVASDAGSVNIAGMTGVYLDNKFDAHAGSQANKGGSVAVSSGYVGNLETDASVAHVTHIGSYSSTSPNQLQTSSQYNQAYVDPSKLESAGFDRITISSNDKIQLEGDLTLGQNKVLEYVKLDAANIVSTGGNTKINSSIVTLGNERLAKQSATTASVAGDGSLSVNADYIELVGNTNLSGISKASLSSTGELRLIGVQETTKPQGVGALNTLANLDLTANLVSPSSLTSYSINASNSDVHFKASAKTQNINPYSVMGTLNVNAKNIEQDGRIVAPFGTVNLNASEQLNLNAGSLTSVSAPAGMVLPFGNTLNGLTWYFDKNNDNIASDAEKIDALSTKTVKLTGKNVAVNSGAKVDISGGGDIQASEFASGPGGLVDVLASDGYYAILPGYNSIVAPTDVLRDGSPVAGKAIYLSGGNGLAAGNYTLLPAKYALLPGAYAVKVTGGVSNVVPNSNSTKSDGTSVITGFLSDNGFTRSDIGTATWTGYEVLTRDQVRQKSEYSLTSASGFFAKNSVSSLPADAGLLQIDTKKSLVLNGQLETKPALGGKGSAVDIVADKLAIVDASSAASVVDGEVAVDITQLNALNADSLLLGATREKADGKTKLNVSANTVRMDSNGGGNSSALKGREVMLAAKDNISMQHDSSIVAQGATGNVGAYAIEGDGAFVRAAATDAVVQHTGTVNRTTGNIVAGGLAKIESAKSIILDATNGNGYQGGLTFVNNGVPLAGNLAIGANRINFGEVPAGTEGLVIDQNRLASFNGLSQATLRSYSSFDFYGNSSLGTNNPATGYSIDSLSLQGGALKGIGKVGDLVTIQAKSLQLSNPDGISVAAATANNSMLTINTNQLSLGQGDKVITGFSNVTINANEVVAQGKGSLNLDANTQLNTARLSGESSANQAINSSAALQLAQLANVATPAISTAIGNSWKITASSLDVNTLIEAHGGDINLKATSGDVTLGKTAMLDASAREFTFFDKATPYSAGSVSISAVTGNVIATQGATVNVSSAAGGDAGKLSVSTPNGEASIANATLLATNVADAKGKQGKGGSLILDTKVLSNFNVLNTQLNTGGFTESRDLRVRTGDINITQAGVDAIKAHQVSIKADAGKIAVSGEIDASGNQSGRGNGGTIELVARDNVILTTSANLKANATAKDEKGGKVTLATTSGNLDLQGGTINVADSEGKDSGTVLLRTPMANVGNSIIKSEIKGAASTVLAPVNVYENVETLTNNTTGGTSLGVDKILADTNAYMVNKIDIINGLGNVVQGLGDRFHIRVDNEIRSSGDLVVQDDVSFYQANREGGEPATLTLRAVGNLSVNGSISDGFTTAATNAAIDPNKQDSWSYRLVAGADMSAADTLAVNQNKTGDFKLAAGKLIRTGTGNIDIAAAGDFDLGYETGAANSQTGVIYTAGKLSDPLDGFSLLTTSATNYLPPDTKNFTLDGGDISLSVQGDVRGAQTNQLYSNWLFRQGKVNADGNFDNTNPQTAWWVRFDQFQQGIGALGGGNVVVKSGGNIENLSVSSASNGRMAALTPSADNLTVWGGGDVNIEAGKDILGGQYYAAKGELNILAKGDIKANANTDPLYTTIALGDAQAKITAVGDVNIEAVINPTMVQQTISKSSTAAEKAKYNIFGSSDNKLSIFSTYTDKTSVAYSSLNGDVILQNYITDDPTTGLLGAYTGKGVFWEANGYDKNVLKTVPGNVQSYAFNGDIAVKGSMYLYPSSQGNLELLARGSVELPSEATTNIVMSDVSPSSLSTATGFVSKSVADLLQVGLGYLHAAKPLHIADTEPVRVYAVTGDISGNANTNNSITVAKQARLIAGNDIKNIGFTGQNLSVDDVTYVKAGHDIVYEANVAQKTNGFVLGGPGRFEFESGRNLDLGSTNGISTIGNLQNTALSSDGADINIALGVANGVDYAGAIDRLIAAINLATASGGQVNDSTLWQVRWLTGNSLLANNSATLLTAVESIKTQGAEVERTRVRSMFYQALRDTGIDSDPSSGSAYVGNFDRGYDTINLLFPGANEKNADGSAKNYLGDLSIVLTSVKTKRGGDIEYMVPGGGALIGLAQISDPVLAPYSESADNPRNTTTLGIVAVEKGAIRGFTRDDMLVNQSRILTVGNAGHDSDILLWSSEGDLNAGKGKRTASVVPPPIITVDSSGNVKVTLQGAATGSGIGALGDNAGDVGLFAPKGTIDAGDAGIRAKNVFLAGLTVLNASNISASGTATGTQVAVAGALNGTLTSSAGAGDPSKAINDASKAIQAPAEPFKKPPSPSFINVEVVSIGD
ncbi:MAG TPA: filamentous hemagglutinin family protein [Methylophilaceae bacterium]|jgi:filamentous hemagglutinin family protein